MRVRWLKRGLFWLVQTGLITGLAWYLLHWNYWERLMDLVPWSIPTFHHLKILFVAMTLITGALASGIALIFAARVEQRPLAYAPGVTLCTCVALWAYTFVALVGQDGFEVNTVFLGGRGYEFYCVIVATWIGVVNGLLSLFAGALNGAPTAWSSSTRTLIRGSFGRESGWWMRRWGSCLWRRGSLSADRQSGQTPPGR